MVAHPTIAPVEQRHIGVASPACPAVKSVLTSCVSSSVHVLMLAVCAALGLGWGPETGGRSRPIDRCASDIGYLWRHFPGHDLACLSEPSSTPMGKNSGRKVLKKSPVLLEARYSLHNCIFKPRSNLLGSRDSARYFISVNCATLMSPRRKRSAHPVK